MESEIRHGTKVGRFVVVAELGSGGMGIVYAAHDRELDRQVALKVMRGSVEHEEEDRKRMLREGQAMARVTHPNVITVYEVGSEGRMVFLAQELLDGGSLAKWLETKHPQHEILEKFIAAGRGLQAAHAVGLVHRDFKPDNVLLGKDGRVRVADFGLARAVGAFADTGLVGPTNRGGGPPRDDLAVTRTPLNNLTKTGAVMGTPMFMAPEQHEGNRADERSDQFAFCVALYHALYGAYPFDGKTAVALADNVINGVMEPMPKNADVSPRLRKILLRGLSIDSTQRYPSMEALLEDLAAPESSKGKTIAIAIAGAVIVAGAAATMFIVLGGKPKQPDQPKVIEQPKPVSADRDMDPTKITEALDLGQLALARKSFDDDALANQTDASKSIAQSAAALMIALSGDLPGAETKLKEAASKVGGDPKAIAYADLVAATIAHSRGELPGALERSQHCIETLGLTEPITRSMCFHVKGDTASDQGDAASARTAYGAGLLLAEQANNPERMANLRLALNQLNFDEQHEDIPLDGVLKLQKEARKRRAVSCEANAAVLASRIRLRKGDQQNAMTDLDDLDPKALQVYRQRMLAQIAIGEVFGYRGEADEDGVMGMDRINDAIDDAKKHDFWGLVMEAQLARVRVLLTRGDAEGEDERKKLIEEANRRGFKRIAKLAAAYTVNAETPPQTPPPQ